MFVGSSLSGTLGIHGVFVLDIGNPASPVLVDSLSLPENIRDVAVKDSFVFAACIDKNVYVLRFVNGDSGLVSVDTILAGSREIQGLSIQGNYCYATTYDGGEITSIDVSDPANAIVAGQCNTDGLPSLPLLPAGSAYPAPLKPVPAQMG